MPSNKRARSGRPSQRRGQSPRYVEPVLDPTWSSAYGPSPEERLDNKEALRRTLLKQSRGVMATGLLIGVAAVPLLTAAAHFSVVISITAALLIVGGSLLFVNQRLRAIEGRLSTVASNFVASFLPGGAVRERQRLTTIVARLSATFGLSDVSSFVVDDAMYNGALVPNGNGFSLFVTSGVMSDFDLLELEGVVAHLMARERLGQLERVTASALLGSDGLRAAELAGVGSTYRADEVAAAAIRHPMGLASALSKCSLQTMVPGSFFAGEKYRESRWVWFNVHADRSEIEWGDLDDVSVRSRALAEW